MVLPLLGNDGLNGFDRELVFASQLLELVLQMTEDDSLYRHRGSGDCSATKETCDQAKRETTDAAKPVAPAARSIAPLKLGPECGSVPLFVRLELR